MSIPPEVKIPYGFCRCGCGLKTIISSKTDRKYGWVKGEPKRFLSGHQNGRPRNVPSVRTVDGVRVFVIDLLYGNEAIVDLDTPAAILNRKWVKSAWGYAVSRIPGGGIDFLHRLVIGAQKGEEVDHRNGIRLDCRTSNLRKCSHYENMQNRAATCRSTTGLKGVYWQRNGYVVSIGANGRKLYLGRRRSKREAAELYNSAALQHHGEFAVLHDLEDL